MSELAHQVAMLKALSKPKQAPQSIFDKMYGQNRLGGVAAAGEDAKRQWVLDALKNGQTITLGELQSVGGVEVRFS